MEPSTTATTAALEVAGLPVGTGHPCVIIAEIGLNHNGELTVARTLIEAAAKAGASLVKFQKRDVAGLAIRSVLDAPDARFPAFGTTYRQIREHLEFGWEAYVELKQASEQHGVPFLVTPFDIPSVDFLERLGVSGYKIASHSVTNLPLLEHVAACGKGVIMSTGMCTLEELDEAVGVFAKQGTPLGLLHCVSTYPTPPSEANLLRIPMLRARYGLPVGYSGHEVGYALTLAAVALGAVVVERHCTLDRTMMGFDHKLSVNLEEFAQMVQAIRVIEPALGTDEKAVSEQEMVTRNKYHVSMVSARAIAAGEPLTLEMITFKNPGTGLAPRRLPEVLGRRARVRIPADVLIGLGMLERA